MDQEMENSTELLTLLDEEGNEHEFEVIDSADYKESSYVALVPVFETPEDKLDDSDDLVILKVIEEDGEEFLEAIEDESEFDEVGAFFMERLKDEFDFDENE